MCDKPRIYADFQNIDNIGRLILSCSGTQRDINTQKLILTSGLEVTFYSDDIGDNGEEDVLLVGGKIEFDDRTQTWVGVYNPDRFRHASDDK